MKLRGYGFIVMAAILWGLIGPLSRWAFAEGLSPLEVAFWRAVLAWGLFGTHAFVKREIRFAREDAPLLVLFGFTGITCFYGVYQVAVSSGGAALSAVLLYTAPAWVTVLSRVFLKESFSAGKLAALALTLLGVAGVSLGTGSGLRLSPLALGSGLAAGFFYSLYYIFGKRFSGKYTAPGLFFLILPFGALTLLPFVSFSPISGKAWISLILLAVVSTYGANFCYYNGLKYLEASRAAITATLEPVVAGGIAFLWWGEVFTLTGYLGSLLIIGAVILMIREEKPPASRVRD